MDRLTFGATATVTGRTLTGVAHTYGTRTLVGGTYVEFDRHAFDDALRGSDVMAFWNHDTRLVLGSQHAGTVTVTSEDDGLHYSITVPETTYADDMLAVIERGDLRSMSFGIMPGKVKTSRAPDGKRVQTHVSVESLFDISPVSLPAFTSGTSIQLHSQRNVMNLSETLAAMDALRVPEGEVMSDEAIAQFKEYEADVARFNETDAIRQRLTDYRKPVTGFPSVIKATPKGDEALEFAFTQYLRTGHANADVQQLFAQTVGSDSAGGYTVPSGFRSKIVERLMAFGGIRSVAETLDTGNGIPLEWPTNDDTPSAQTDAGFRADIVAEGAASVVGADVVFGTKTLGAYRFAATGTGNVPIKVSVELLQDSAFDIAGFVARKLGERIGRRQAYSLAMGTGTDQPEGLFDQTLHPGDVATTTGASMVPTYAQLNQLIHEVDPAYRQLGNCRWIMNDSTQMVLENITDATLGRPLLLPAQGSISGSIPSGTLLGYPVTIDQAVPSGANNVNFIAFGDFRRAFVVRNVRDVQILVNPYAATGYVVYDGWARMDSVIQDNYAYATMEGLT